MNRHRLPFQAGDPSLTHFQYLEDLSTAYWYSEVLFAALFLKLFDAIEANGATIHAIARTAACRPAPLERLLRALDDLELVHHGQDGWCNSQLARRHLISASPDYMGEFLLYRRYIRPHWQDLARQTSEDPDQPPFSDPSGGSYEQRNLAYTRAMDVLARLKSKEIEAALEGVAWSPPILDLGGGAGAVGRRLIQGRPDAACVLLDLPEVIGAARRLYPQMSDWQRILPVGGDFRNPPFLPSAAFGLIVLSNFLHAYDDNTVHEILMYLYRAAPSKPDAVIMASVWTGTTFADPAVRTWEDTTIAFNVKYQGHDTYLEATITDDTSLRLYGATIYYRVGT